MTYNIHPIFVHFPIALLFVYSLIKVIPLSKWFSNVAWRDIERLLLFLGVLGTFAALYTGGIAEHLVRPNRQLVNTHATFAMATTYIYGALLLGELASYLNSKGLLNNFRSIDKLSRFIERILRDKFFSIILVVLGLVTLTLAGMLGGIITYGVGADPLAPFVVRMLGITL